MKKNSFIKNLAVAVSVALLSSTALAHTISVGYTATSTANIVDFFAGTYHTGSITEQGTGHLVGVGNNYDSGIMSFNMPVVGSKPTGLVDGTNNFYFAPTTAHGSCQSGATYGSATDTCSEGIVTHWEGIQFTGLAAGTYDFTIGNDSRTTFVFQDPGTASIRITLLATDVTPISPVPEPTVFALFGIGLVGFAIARRKFKQ